MLLCGSGGVGGVGGGGSGGGSLGAAAANSAQASAAAAAAAAASAAAAAASMAAAGGFGTTDEDTFFRMCAEIQRNREFYKNADVRPPFTYASLIRQVREKRPKPRVFIITARRRKVRLNKESCWIDSLVAFKVVILSSKNDKRFRSCL